MSQRVIPKKYRALYAKAMAKRSRKAAVRMGCLECCGYSEEEVRKCTDTGCPTYRYRETG